MNADGTIRVALVDATVTDIPDNNIALLFDYVMVMIMIEQVVATVKSGCETFTFYFWWNIKCSFCSCSMVVMGGGCTCILVHHPEQK